MDKVLVVKNKLLSLRGHIFIYDENGEQVYDAKGSLSLFSPKYTLSNGNETLAVIKKRFWLRRFRLRIKRFRLRIKTF